MSQHQRLVLPPAHCPCGLGPAVGRECRSLSEIEGFRLTSGLLAEVTGMAAEDKKPCP